MQQQLGMNPKALKLEGLEGEKNKVTVGFKCHAQTKLRLANDATAKGITLSEYVETLILTNGQNNRAAEKLTLKEIEVNRLNEQIADLTNRLKDRNEKHVAKDLEIKRLNGQITLHTERFKIVTESQTQSNVKEARSKADLIALQKRIDFYEKDPLMVSLFAKHKGTNQIFKHSDGGTWNLEIKDIQDVFTVIVNKAKMTK